MQASTDTPQEEFCTRDIPTILIFTITIITPCRSITETSIPKGWHLKGHHRPSPLRLMAFESLQPWPPSQNRVLRPDGLEALEASFLPHALQLSASACSALQ